MKNTEKNSWRSKLLRYFFYLLLLSLLILGGVYWYITEPDRKLARDIADIKNTSGVQYKELNNNEIVLYNEGNIHTKLYLIEKLDRDTNLTQKQREKFREVLKEITNNIDEDLEQETLEGNSEEEKKDKILKILQTQYSLNILEGKVIKLTEAQKEKLWEEENKWLNEFYPAGFIPRPDRQADDDTEIPAGEKNEEDKEIFREIDKFMKHFYDEFKRVHNINKPVIVQPIYIIEDEKEVKVTDKTPQAKINERIEQLKNEGFFSRHRLNPVAKMQVDWEGFAGWHKNWNEKKEGASIGLTSYTQAEKYDNKVKACWKRKISITLDARFPFSRRGKGYESWQVKRENRKFSNMKFDWNTLIETIAHELAHAIINSEYVSYRDDKDNAGKERGGHGTKHYDYTKKMRELIKRDEEGKTKEFKKFWFKK